MRIKVTGRQIDIGDALRTHVREAIEEIAAKYAEEQRPTDATVIFSRDAAAFKCEATLHLSSGMVAVAHGSAHEIYAAFDQCAERLEKQLRRYKRRLKDHHRGRDKAGEVLAAPAATPAEADHEADEAESGPLIVAEEVAEVPAMTVGEAVTALEQAGVTLLVFRNEVHKGVNVVYRRADGNFGWINPQLAAAE